MYSKPEELLNSVNIQKNTEEHSLFFETAEKIIAEQKDKTPRRITSSYLYQKFVQDQLKSQEDKLMEENPFFPEGKYCPMMNRILKKLASGIYPKTYADEQMLNQLFANDPFVLQQIKQCPLIKKTNSGYAFRTESLLNYFAANMFHEPMAPKEPSCSGRHRQAVSSSKVEKTQAIAPISPKNSDLQDPLLPIVEEQKGEKPTAAPSQEEVPLLPTIVEKSPSVTQGDSKKLSDDGQVANKKEPIQSNTTPVPASQIGLFSDKDPSVKPNRAQTSLNKENYKSWEMPDWVFWTCLGSVVGILVLVIYGIYKLIADSCIATADEDNNLSI